MATPPGRPKTVVFASSTVGYAYGLFGDGRGNLDITRDGGHTWTATQQGTVGLAAAGGTVWQLQGVPGPQILRAPVGAVSFSKVGYAGNRDAEVRATSTGAYILGRPGAGPVAPNLEVATATGVTLRSLPCDDLFPDPRGTGYPLDLLPLDTPDQVVAACEVPPIGSKTAPDILYRSIDDGRSWVPLATLPSHARWLIWAAPPLP